MVTTKQTKSKIVTKFDTYLKNNAPEVYEKLTGTFKKNVIIGILESYAQQIIDEERENVMFYRSPKSHLIFTEGKNYRYTLLDNFCTEFNTEEDPVHEMFEYGNQIIGENIIVIHNNIKDVNCVFILDGTTGEEFIYLCVYIG